MNYRFYNFVFLFFYLKDSLKKYNIIVYFNQDKIQLVIFFGLKKINLEIDNYNIFNAFKLFFKYLLIKTSKYENKKL
jgi:hypothetical protein